MQCQVNVWVFGGVSDCGGWGGFGFARLVVPSGWCRGGGLWVRKGAKVREAARKSEREVPNNGCNERCKWAKKNEQLKLLSFVGAASHFGQSFAMRIVTRRKQMSGIVCTKFGEIEKKRTYENEHNTAWSHVLYQ